MNDHYGAVLDLLDDLCPDACRWWWRVSHGGRGLFWLAQAETGEGLNPAICRDKAIDVLFESLPIIVEDDLVGDHRVGFDCQKAGHIHFGIVPDCGIGRVVVIAHKDCHRTADRLRGLVDMGVYIDLDVLFHIGFDGHVSAIDYDGRVVADDGIGLIMTDRHGHGA